MNNLYMVLGSAVALVTLVSMAVSIGQRSGRLQEHLERQDEHLQAQDDHLAQQDTALAELRADVRALRDR